MPRGSAEGGRKSVDAGADEGCGGIPGTAVDHVDRAPGDQEDVELFPGRDTRTGQAPTTTPVRSIHKGTCSGWISAMWGAALVSR
jgi:hypothetical protein